MRIAAQNITARLRTSVFGSIVKQEAGYFDKTKTGELVNRLSADSQLVSQAVTQQISGLFTIYIFQGTFYFRVSVLVGS